LFLLLPRSPHLTSSLCFCLSSALRRRRAWFVRIPIGSLVLPIGICLSRSAIVVQFTQWVLIVSHVAGLPRSARWASSHRGGQSRRPTFLFPALKNHRRTTTSACQSHKHPVGQSVMVVAPLRRLFMALPFSGTRSHNIWKYGDSAALRSTNLNANGNDSALRTSPEIEFPLGWTWIVYIIVFHRNGPTANGLAPLSLHPMGMSTCPPSYYVFLPHGCLANGARVCPSTIT
jgi:hypothetical protein